MSDRRPRSPLLPKSPLTSGSWIVEAGGGSVTGGGTTPPLPPSDAAAAPNVTDASVTVQYEGTNFSFSGIILLPTTDPKYANLKRIEVWGAYPSGQNRFLGAITSWSGTTVAYKFPVGLRPSAHQDWVLTFPVFNANGTMTTGALSRPIGVDPLTTSSVTASEVGPRTQDKDRNLHTVIGITPALVPATFPQDVTLWLQYGDNVDVWQGWFTVDHAGQQFRIGDDKLTYQSPGAPSGPAHVKLFDRVSGTIFVPINPAYGTWTVKAAPGRVNDGVNPATVGAVSSTFSVTPVGVCIPDGIKDARFLTAHTTAPALRDLSPDKTILYSKYNPGTWCWAYVGIEFTTPNFLTDNSYWETEMTVQKGYSQIGTGTVSGSTTFTSDPGSFLPEQVGFEIHINGKLTTIAACVSDSVITLAAGQPNGTWSFELWNEAPDDEGVNEDPFLHYRGRRFFSSPQIQDMAVDAVQVITSMGANPANWRIPLDTNPDDSPNLFREYRFRIYNVSRLGTDRSGAGGAATHSLQTVAWNNTDHGTLIPIAPGHVLDLRHTNPKSLADALHGGGGQPVKVVVAPPLYIDQTTNSASIALSGDYVVVENPPGSGHYELSQKVVDLAKAINFGNNPNGVPMFTTNGNTIFLINAIGVNYLIAGDALFTGDVTFARTGTVDGKYGGKVTINDTGVRLDDNLTTPTATVFVTSTGFQAQKGNNKLIANAGGIQLQSVVAGLTNTLTMDANRVQLFSQNQSLTLDSGKVQIQMGGVNAPTLTLDANGVKAQAGAYILTVAANQIKLDNGSGYTTTIQSDRTEIMSPGGRRLTATSNGIEIWADAQHYVQVFTNGVNIVGGTFTAPAVLVNTANSYVVRIDGTSNGISITALGTLAGYFNATNVHLSSASISTDLTTTVVTVGSGDATFSELRSGAGGLPASLTVGGVQCINNLGYYVGPRVNVQTVQTSGQTRIDSTGMVNCDSLQVRGTQRIDTNGVYRGGLQWNDHVYAGDFGIMAGGVAGAVGVVGTSGSFTTANGKTVTVWGGIITAISP